MLNHIKTISMLTIVVVLCLVAVYKVDTKTAPIIVENLARESGKAKYEFFKDDYDINELTHEVVCDINIDTEDVSDDCGFDDSLLTLEEHNIVEITAMKLDEEVIGYVYSALASGFGGEISYLIGADVSEEPKVLGIKVLVHTETPGLGSLITEPEFTDQFNHVDLILMHENGFDGVTSATPTITNQAMVDSVTKVLGLHRVAMLGQESVDLGPVVIEVEPESIDQSEFAEFYTETASFTEVYASLEANLNILNIYEAYDETGNVLGFVYYLKSTGAGGDIKYLLSVDTSNVVRGVKLASTSSKESWEYSGASEKSFEESKWLENLVLEKNLVDFATLDSEVDGVAGVTITTSGVIDSLKAVSEYHLNLASKSIEFDFALLFNEAASVESTYNSLVVKQPGVLNVYNVLDANGNKLGTALYLSAIGLSGDIEYFLGVDNKGVIVNAKIIDRAQLESWEYSEVSDTPFIEHPWFSETVISKNINDLAKLDSSVDGVAGVSVTTGGMISSLINASNYYLTLTGKTVEFDYQNHFTNAKSIESIYSNLPKSDVLLNAFDVTDGKDSIGIIYYLKAVGLSGDIEYLLGVDTQNIIVSLEVIYREQLESWEHSGASETSFIENPWFEELVIGKKVSDLAKLNPDVDGISGVTHTTSGVIESLKKVGGAN